MSEQIAYLELKYGKIFDLDLHGKTKEEARAELIYQLSRLDVFYKGILVTHGYHQGTVLRDFVRKEFNHHLVTKKINIDSSRTLLLVDLE